MLFHDIDLKRLTGSERIVNDTAFAEMREILENAGRVLDTFDDLYENYKGDSYVLCDIGNDDRSGGFYWECDDAFFKMLAQAPFKVICGVHKAEEARLASKYFPKEQILAFMPEARYAEDFYKNGAGIIRLWEHWLCKVTPDDIKKLCPDAEVWIMANTEAHGQDGCPESIDNAIKLGADGMILNDIRMAVNHVLR